MENAGYLLAAFGIIWAALFGYVLALLNREKALRREIESLRRELKDEEDR